jgi:hypothetical protein
VPIVIIDRQSHEQKIVRLTRGDWKTCEAALRYKRAGKWGKVKHFLNNRDRRKGKGWWR